MSWTTDETAAVLREVGEERVAQDEKWGEQNHPDGTARPNDRDLADLHRQLCDVNAMNGHATFRDILLEEVYEAVAEADPAALRTELVQVAAVAVAWIEAIDRRTA